ncbi:MAG: hypothetical protein GKR95_19300 [Gammaproteobacteria bacterium]|nr:hypothetical protein [Gammaproteobacteria bacterium]
MKKSDKTPFFVGYLDMPKTLKRFYIPLVFFVGVLSAVAGMTIANQQQSAGPAVWDSSAAVTYTGLLKMEPYPVLHRLNPDNGDQAESILLVNQGKHSSAHYATPLKDQFVSVTGYPIVRGGWSMLELVSDEPIKDVKTVVGDEAVPKLVSAASPVSLGPVSLNGEIADSKCFLGVMNPGKGSVHKACAEVCLLGGIPAMLLVRGDDGQKYGYLLTQPDGSNISREIASRAADHVAVTGELMQKGDLLYIQVAENGIL